MAMAISTLCGIVSRHCFALLNIFRDNCHELFHGHRFCHELGAGFSGEFSDVYPDMCFRRLFQLKTLHDNMCLRIFDAAFVVTMRYLVLIILVIYRCFIMAA